MSTGGVGLRGLRDSSFEPVLTTGAAATVALFEDLEAPLLFFLLVLFLLPPLPGAAADLWLKSQLSPLRQDPKARKGQGLVFFCALVHLSLLSFDGERAGADCERPRLALACCVFDGLVIREDPE